MNYETRCRTNYVRLSDEAGFLAAIEPFDVELIVDTKGRVGLIGPEGGFDHEVWLEDSKDLISFSFYTHVMPFVEEGQVLVTKTIGHEGDRYLVGLAEAFIRRGDKVDSVFVDLSDIYEKASSTFGAPSADIKLAEY